MTVGQKNFSIGSSMAHCTVFLHSNSYLVKIVILSLIFTQILLQKVGYLKVDLVK